MSDTSANGLGALSGTLLGLSTVTVVLRFYARSKQKLRFQLDDWFILPAMLMFIGLAIAALYAVSHQILGYAEPDDKQAAMAMFPGLAKTMLAIDSLSVLALGLIRLSALFFYRRVFHVPGYKDAFNRLVVGTVVVVALWTVTFFILTFLVCGSNLQYFWDPVLNSKCWISYPFLYGLAISDFILDVFVICLPIPKIWNLNSSTRRKLGIIGVFLMALIGLGASTARLVQYVQLETAGRTANAQDPYLANTKAVYFSILEAGLSLIAANLPSLWYFIGKERAQRTIRRFRSSIASLGTSSGGSRRRSQHHRVNSTSSNKPIIGTFDFRRASHSADTMSSKIPFASRVPRRDQALSYPGGKTIESYAVAMTTMGKNRGDISEGEESLRSSSLPVNDKDIHVDTRIDIERNGEQV